MCKRGAYTKTPLHNMLRQTVKGELHKLIQVRIARMYSPWRLWWASHVKTEAKPFTSWQLAEPIKPFTLLQFRVRL